MSSLPSGTHLLHFRVIEKIGQGGMGEVYLAEDLRLGRKVALKILPDSPGSNEKARRRLIQEARSASVLNHPNIVTVHSIEESGGTDFIVMEYVEGESLSSKLGQDLFDFRKVLDIAAQIADGLAAAHAAGVIHRDIKPSNILIANSGRVKILDFGLAKLISCLGEDLPSESDHITEEGTILGTVSYMSPEQVRGESLDHRSDLFSFGSLLYECATGRLPFNGPNRASIMYQIVNSPVIPPSTVRAEIPSAFDDLIHRTLARAREDRYASAQEMAEAIRLLSFPQTEVISPKPVSAQRANLGIRERFAAFPWRSRPRVLAAALAIAAVVAAVAGWYLNREKQSTPASKKIESLAVLPLANLSGDPGQEYFVDGMTEALITDLARIRDLKVISRTSVMQFKNVKKTVRQIARELDVDAVVEGSVIRSGDRVRMTVQLIDAATDAHLWAESYERDMQDILDLQSQMARAIAAEIQITLDSSVSSGGDNSAQRRQVHPLAHQEYLKGRYHLLGTTTDAYEQALDAFQKALSFDSNEPLAHAGLAETYLLMGTMSLLPPADAYTKAKAAAERALLLDPDLAEARTVRASILHHYYWDHRAAEREYRLALKLSPNNASIHESFAFFLGLLRRFDEALNVAKRGRELDPLNLRLVTLLGELYTFSRKYEEAITQYRRVLELDPTQLEARWYLAMTLAYTGKYDEAMHEMRELQSIDPFDPVAVPTIALIQGLAGNPEHAVGILDEVRQNKSNRYIRPYLLAWLSLVPGEQDEALGFLEKSCEEHDEWITYINVDPLMDPLKTNPRFQAILKRLNLATDPG